MLCGNEASRRVVIWAFDGGDDRTIDSDRLDDDDDDDDRAILRMALRLNYTTSSRRTILQPDELSDHQRMYEMGLALSEGGCLRY